MPATASEAAEAALDRCQARWVYLFFGLLAALHKRDPKLVDAVYVSLADCGLATLSGDLPALTEAAVAMDPSEETVRRADRFRDIAHIPQLRGRRRRGRLLPPFLQLLMTYYELLWDERQRKPAKGMSSPSERALRRAAEKLGYSSLETCTKHLNEARRRYPGIARAGARKGIERIEVFE